MRRAELEHRIDATRAALAEASAVPRLLLVDAEYDVARLTAERDWVAGLLADLDMPTPAEDALRVQR